MSRARLPNLGWLVVGYGITVLLGRLTVGGPGTLSLVWPAAGVAAAWFWSLTPVASRRRILIDYVALAGITFIVLLATAATWTMALDRALGAVLQFLVMVEVLRRTATSRDALGRPVMANLADLGRLTAVAAVGALVNTLVALVVLLPDGEVAWSDAVNLWTRQVAGVVCLGLPLLVLWHGDDRSRRSGRFGLMAVGATSAVVFGAAFWWFSGTPLGYALLVPSIAAGTLLRPAGAAAHGVISATAAVCFTLAGSGPFSRALAGEAYTSIAQLCAMLIVVTGLSLSLVRAESRQLADRLAERARDSEVRLDEVSTIIETVHDGIVVIKQDGSVPLANPAGLQLVGAALAEQDESPAAGSYRTFHADGRPLTRDDRPSLLAMRTGEVVVQTVTQRADGRPDRVLRVIATPIDGPAEDPQRRVVVVLTDVTLVDEERRSLASFAGIVAHDLLNPIGVVDGWAEALQEAFEDHGVVTSDVGSPMVERVRRSARSMQHFVQDLLAFTTARDRAIEPRPVDLSLLVGELAALRRDVTPAAGGPAIEVSPLPRVFVDPFLMRQLFDNLLGNAVKYVAPGTVPHVCVDSVPGPAGFATLRVTDNGIGIPEGERDKVFDEFQRLQPEGYSGTGLGLAICRRIIERHGGHIWVESAPDQPGSRFAFDLPLTASSLAASPG
ncbi:ATP-binding protein [Nocardioides acrostichi]|uniref:Sensor-like histidine kinase SenX3 n=1 Tax=Nocardioides acrostichi TaxID=2784339 RepID=A0A930V0Z5_9ACTN|nr:ATP-binding protein [Nocardioides acrostichi]MBF4162044.1 hypothetical protein [Nocardioides acrostichi]